MSTSLSPRSSGHPTRQQLDELDALLQRMLALPVNQAGDDVTAEISAAPRPAPTPRREPVSYRTPEYPDDEPAGEDVAAPKAPPRLDGAHVPEDAADDGDGDNWVPLSSTWKPSPHTWKPLAQSWQQPRHTAPAQESPADREEPVAVAAPPAVEPPAPDAPPGTEAVPAAPTQPARMPVVPVEDGASPGGWERSLVRFNDAFDLLLLPFGTPGRWLRRDGGGRLVLGGAGVLLLAAAVALGVMGWFGWTWDDLLAKMP
jgi:hypothetical protein